MFSKNVNVFLKQNEIDFQMKKIKYSFSMIIFDIFWYFPNLSYFFVIFIYLWISARGPPFPPLLSELNWIFKLNFERSQSMNVWTLNEVKKMNVNFWTDFF